MMRDPSASLPFSSIPSTSIVKALSIKVKVIEQFYCISDIENVVFTRSHYPYLHIGR